MVEDQVHIISNMELLHYPPADLKQHELQRTSMCS